MPAVVLNKKLDTLNMQGKRKESISLLRSHFKKHQVTDQLELRLAFFLYHHALEIYYGDGAKIDKEKAKQEFDEDIKICRKIIKDCKNKKLHLNASIYLAQIYACLGKKKAIEIARKNYLQEKSSVTANRLADVYERLGDNSKALSWYKKEEMLAKKEKPQSVYYILNLAMFYKRIGKNKLAEEYVRTGLKLLPKNIQGRSMKRILLSYFPDLK